MSNFLENVTLGIEKFYGNEVQPSHEIFNHGLSYYQAYLKLKDDSQTYNPSYVCLAFSIELFLKCLETKKYYQKEESNLDTIIKYKVLDEPHSQGHNFTALFELLSKETQHSIQSSYHNDHHSNFSEDLKIIANGFVEWRYIYEHKVDIINLSNLQKIGLFLANFSNNKLNCGSNT